VKGRIPGDDVTAELEHLRAENAQLKHPPLTGAALGPGITREDILALLE
jgi:hypothetical protein